MNNNPTPILPFIQERLEPTKKEIKDDLFLWLSGKKFPNLEFSGSLPLNYWGPYLDGHVKKIIDTAFTTNKEIATEHGLDPSKSINDGTIAAEQTIKEILNLMADYDRRMRGKGYPQSVPIRDIAEFWTKHSEAVRTRAENEFNLLSISKKGQQTQTYSPIALKITDSASNNVFVGCTVNGGVEINKKAEGNKFIQTEITSRKEINPTPNPTATNPDKITTEKKNWQSSPLYYIAVGVIIVMLGAFLIYLTRKHLGISL